MAHDFDIIDEGSVVGIKPLSEAAQDWLDENVQSGSWQWLGGTLWIDHRYADAIITGMIDDGLTDG